MEDRELLDLAARAVGGIYDPLTNCITSDGGIEFEQWEPLDDDGDALRLAIRLSIHVKRYSGATTAQQWTDSSSSTEHDHWKINGNDEMKSTRRAIVRAAAEIGKAMP